MKYDIGIVIENCNGELLSILEPLGHTIYTDMDTDQFYRMKTRSSGSNLLLKEKLKTLEDLKTNKILIEVNSKDYSIGDHINMKNLEEVLEGKKIGSFNLGGLFICILRT